MRKPLTKELEKVEKRMTVLQTAKAEIDQFMADESSYADANKSKLMEMLKRQGEVNGELETLEEKWLELQEQIEQCLRVRIPPRIHATSNDMAANKNRRLRRRFFYPINGSSSRADQPTASVSVRMNSQISDQAGTDRPSTGGSGAVHSPSE